MAGLRRGFRWSATGIAEKLGSDLESALRYLRSVHSFSVAVSEFLRSVEQIELLQGQLLEDIVVQPPSVVAGVQTFPHSLGRIYRGAIVVAVNSNVLLLPVTSSRAMSAATGMDPAQYVGIAPLELAAAPVTCSLWVF